MRFFLDSNILDERLKEQTDELKAIVKDELNLMAIQIGDMLKAHAEEIKRLNVRISELETRLSDQIKAQGIIHATAPKENASVQKKSVIQPAVQQKPQPEQFYAIMEEELQLVRVDNNQQNTAQFIINATGDTGTASFNQNSLQFCLGNIEGEVLPYFECEVKSRTPSIIKDDGPVKVERNSRGVWILKESIKLTLE